MPTPTLVTVELVQQWLEKTKLTVGQVPDELDQTARDVVFGRVSQVYDTSTWVNTATTPSLILRIVSMLVAAWIYQSQYSENLEIDAGNWGVKLESLAMGLIDGIVEQTIDIIDGGVVSSDLSNPLFFPTDAQDTDGEGSEIKFSMGRVF